MFVPAKAKKAIDWLKTRVKNNPDTTHEQAILKYIDSLHAKVLKLKKQVSNAGWERENQIHESRVRRHGEWV